MLRFLTNTVIELEQGLQHDGQALIPRKSGGAIYDTLPNWYRTAVRVPSSNSNSQQGFQIIRANVGFDSALERAPGGKVVLRFMEYDLNGHLIGGVDYAMNL